VEPDRGDAPRLEAAHGDDRLEGALVVEAVGVEQRAQIGIGHRRRIRERLCHALRVRFVQNRIERLLDVAPEEVRQAVEDRPARVHIDGAEVMHPVRGEGIRPRVDREARQLLQEVAGCIFVESGFVGVQRHHEEVGVLFAQTDAPQDLR
jgi:hypothetical protein